MAAGKVKKITEELCDHRFSARAISGTVEKLDEQWEAFAQRRLDAPYPYWVLDARHEKVRQGGVIRSQAVLVAVGIGAGGRRSIVGVELTHRESSPSWRKFPERLRERGLGGPGLVVSDDHAGFEKGGCRDARPSSLATLLGALSAECGGTICRARPAATA